MELKALIFDVDGTLAETEQAGHRMAFNRAFEDAGLDWHWDEELYQELLQIGGGLERFEHYAQVYKNLAREDADELFDRVYRLKGKHYRAIVKGGGITLRPGIRRLITEATDQRVALAIATNSSRLSIAALCGRLFRKLPAQVFDAIITGDKLPCKKPCPVAYEIALERLGFAAGECIAVEDSQEGLAAASSIGIPTVVTVSRYSQDHDFTGAKLVVNHLGEPDRPSRVEAGATLPQGYVDLAALRAIVA